MIVRQDNVKKVNDMKIKEIKRLPIYPDFKNVQFVGPVELGLKNINEDINPELKKKVVSSQNIKLILKQINLEAIQEVVVLNVYKMYVLSRLCKLGCKFSPHELLVELLTRSYGSSHQDAINILSRPISEKDFLILFDMLSLNFLLYYDFDSVLYYKEDENHQTVVFKYINSNDIEYKCVLSSIKDLCPLIFPKRT